MYLPHFDLSAESLSTFDLAIIVSSEQSILIFAINVPMRRNVFLHYSNTDMVDTWYTFVKKHSKQYIFVKVRALQF